MKRFAVLAAAWMACAGLASAEPERHPWANFKPGTWVKFRQSSKMEANGMKMEQVDETTTTLLEVTDSEVVLKIEMERSRTQNGREVKSPKQEQEIRYPLMAEPTRKGETGDGKPETGEEELTIKDKKVKCTWTRSTKEQMGSKMVVKTWKSDAMPGNVVRAEGKSEGPMKGESLGEVLDFLVKEE